KFVLKNFYVRRALRIFPVYYFTIFVIVILHYSWLKLPVTKGEIVAGLTYTSNFYFYKAGAWTPLTAHFWSLSVEEQFYLFWPLLVLFLPKKYLLLCISLFIVTGIASQYIIGTTEFGVLLPNACFDNLGAGALLAWLSIYRPDKLPAFYKIVSVMAALSLLILTGTWLSLIHLERTRTLHALVGCWLVCYALLNVNTKTPLTAILGNPVLTFIGRISYGLYIYHILYYYIGMLLWKKYILHKLSFIDTTYHPWIFLTVNFFFLVGFCWLSWQLIEKPMLSFKKYFQYKKHQVPTTQAAPNGPRPITQEG
ncbi:MAG TPA: acyltransferase, partial [Flavisolibacter sp.]|nr:acyltransferase [Flavisolibacter sp.]